MKKPLFPRIALRILTVLAGAVGGIVIGLYTTIAIVVAKARAGYYLFGFEEILVFNVETVIFVLLVAAGAFLAYRMPARLVRAVVRGLAGMVGGLVMGALFGYLLGGTSEWVWAGALIFSAFLLVGVSALVLIRSKRRALTYTDLGIVSVVGVALAVVFVIGFQEPAAVAVPEIDPALLPPPSAVDDVVFILGDAGAAETGRTPLLEALQHDIEHWSAALARDSAVSVIYAGDLVYPVGVRDRDHPAFAQDSSRLWNQVELVGGPEARRHRTLGLFVPGNHDWGNTAADVGIQRLINLSEQLGLARASGHAVDLFPKAGQPGPIVRDVRANIRFVLLDTHWFLRERSRGVRTAFLARLKEALDTAGDRHVIIVAHHPFQSAGPHGGVVPGYHSWGVEYVLRQAGAIVQDLNAPIYEELLDGMRAIFAGAKRPPLVFAGGHDHSLQVIERQQESDPAYMLVSGAGSKLSSIRSLPGMLYGAARPGYMLLVFRKNAAVDLFVVAGDPALHRCTSEAGDALKRCMTLGENGFDIVYGRTLAEAPHAPVFSDTLAAATSAPTAEPMPEETVVSADAPDEPAAPTGAVAWWTRSILPASSEIAESDDDINTPPPAVPARLLYFNPDSVLATTGASYAAGLLQRIVLGDLNRPLWDVPVRLPVLDLDTLGGGVRVEELTGGMQTLGLRLQGRNGVTYQFRSIVKDASRALSTDLEQAVEGLLQDQLAAQFPLGAMVVAELLKAADVLVATPVPVIMPNDGRLGAYRPYFAGRIGWIEVRPNERSDDAPGFAGSRKVIGGEEIYEALREDPTSAVDARTFLRARLIDFLVGDWDRHAGNWRWARFDDQGRARWVPIPRDRDWAFTRSDGVISTVSPLFFGRYVGFSDAFPPLDRLAASGYRLDHRVLSGVPRTAFEAEARGLQQTLTDSVLVAALAVLPPAYQAIERDRLLRELRARRAFLPRMADAFFDLLAQTVHVYGYDAVIDTVRLQTLGDNQLRVRAWLPGQEATPYFDRTLDGALVNEIRLYVDAGTDVVETDEGFPVPVTLVAPDTHEEEQRAY